MKAALLTDPIYKTHDTGPGHPECAARMDAVLNALAEDGLADKLLAVPPRQAEDADLLRCHTEPYVKAAIEDITTGKPMLRTGDTNVVKASLKAARMAAGAVCAAVDSVFDSANDCTRAFVASRPPGHHAESNKGMGFCVFNNIAVGARYAQEKHGVGRVLIVDWDVHHGNGTQEIFYEDPSVFFLSTHQSPWYPGTGAAKETGFGKGEGSTLNVPLPAGSGRPEVVEEAFGEKLRRAMKDFRPELVLISAGFDSRIEDPLGNFTLTDPDFRDLTALMLEVAEETAEGRVVSVLEGGYNLNGLGKAVRAHVEALAV